MKKTALKVVSISLVALMMCVMLVSCFNKPSGTYEKDGISLTFSGEKVELSYGEDGGKKTTVEGTFEMGEDEEGNPTIKIELPEPSSFLDIEYGTIRALLNGENSYNKGNDNNGDYIEIGGAKFYKK